MGSKIHNTWTKALANFTGGVFTYAGFQKNPEKTSDAAFLN